MRIVMKVNAEGPMCSAMCPMDLPYSHRRPAQCGTQSQLYSPKGVAGTQLPPLRQAAAAQTSGVVTLLHAPAVCTTNNDLWSICDRSHL